MAFAAQCMHQAFLVQRRQPCKQAVLLCSFSQCAVAHAFNLCTGQRGTRVNTHLLTHTRCHQFVVSCEHFDGHAMGLERFNGRSGRLLGWIQKSDIAHQHQVRLISHAIREGLRTLRALDAFAGNSHHTQALVVQLLRHAAHACQLCLGQRQRFHAQTDMAAGRENFFHRPLADQYMLVAVYGAHNHGHAAAHKVKGNLVHLLPLLLPVVLRSRLHVLNHRTVQQVLQPRLVVTVEPGQAQGVL